MLPNVNLTLIPLMQLMIASIRIGKRGGRGGELDFMVCLWLEIRGMIGLIIRKDRINKLYHVFGAMADSIYLSYPAFGTTLYRIVYKIHSPFIL